MALHVATVLKAFLGEVLTLCQGKLLVWGWIPQACTDFYISKCRISLSGLVSLRSLVKKGSCWDMGHFGYAFSSPDAAVSKAYLIALIAGFVFSFPYTREGKEL